MVMVWVKAEGKDQHIAFVACSPCMGIGSIHRGKPWKPTGWLTCPSCYGTGVKDMLYESVVRHGSG